MSDAMDKRIDGDERVALHLEAAGRFVDDIKRQLREGQTVAAMESACNARAALSQAVSDLETITGVPFGTLGYQQLGAP